MHRKKGLQSQVLLEIIDVNLNLKTDSVRKGPTVKINSYITYTKADDRIH